MIVVSDTSPLNYLVLINAIEVLPNLFQEVYVPPRVMEELQRSRTPETVSQWAASPRGPTADIRPTPEQMVAWAAEAGLAPQGSAVDLPPWHYGLRLWR